MTTELVERAREIADTVLFPAALEVDRSGQVPDTHWETLTQAGLYGIAAPADFGGPGLGLPHIVEILETMASGCLATAFTWVQHHGMLAALSVTDNHALRDEILPGAVAGRIRGGVAYAGAVPVPPRMRAQRVTGGWRLSGHAPFVSGWGIIDVIQISAGDVETGDIVAGLVTAAVQPGITAVTPQPLFVADASHTVALELDGLVVPDDRVVSRVSRTDFMTNQNFGSRLNATLPIGVVRRCTLLLDDAGEHDAAVALRRQADAVRERLDEAMSDASALLRARAEGCVLATQAANALVAAHGGPSLLRSSPAQLLARSALFTLVAASRPELKQALINQMSHADC
ncbi:acyl-CoA dehydrogenase [Mycolicibacterium sp. CH28]|uniref:acyl-CoA dehydrogenase family protein n=1 Tax=Mycolicibacterium sp. CH28 TaxID=2512237 RepID=UPI001080F220|nr:acyl-CoA dehydrogenase family protein [Mycolicibacterium sp. CH28]TGD85487.1 acyl-CoA dehydrogenase [Mycolicibacterium sp. CH28]